MSGIQLPARCPVQTYAGPTPFPVLTYSQPHLLCERDRSPDLMRCLGAAWPRSVPGIAQRRRSMRARRLAVPSHAAARVSLSPPPPPPCPRE
eukprot:1850039-Rhodomonas_salina.1